MSSPESILLEKVDISFVPQWGIFVLNNDITPFDFVIDFLMRAFQKTAVEARNIALAAHRDGSCICAQYPKDIAETVLRQVEGMLTSEMFELKFDIKEI